MSIFKSTTLYDRTVKYMRWMNERNVLIAQNLANANSPGYKGEDLQSFATLHQRTLQPSMHRTQSGHVRGNVSAAKSGDNQNFGRRKNYYPHYKSIGHNSVNVEEELIKLNENNLNYQLMLGTYRKSLAWFKIVLGKNS